VRLDWLRKGWPSKRSAIISDIAALLLPVFMRR